MEIKFTKFDKYSIIEEILGATEHEHAQMLIEFVQGEKTALTRKAEKAKAKAAEKKTEIDDLGNAVLAVLTSEPKGRDEIFALVDFADATLAKVGSRLTKLVAANKVQKQEVKAVSATGKKTTRMVYALVSE